MESTFAVLGILLLAAAATAIIFRLIRQSAIVAFIAVGLIAGQFHHYIEFPEELLEIFTELGIILLLFMAGLEVDFASFRKRWRMILTNGLGQIILNTLAGVAVGILVLGLEAPATIVYFGLSLTFSSTIIVIGFLKSHRQIDSLHGQLLLGLMVLQDIVAVGALVMLESLQGSGSLAAGIGMILLKLLLLLLFLAVAARTFLPPLFRFLAGERELLFLGTLGWALGVAAVCELAHFSPEIGAFLAGASISVLPYRLEIQDKVEPMKDFGIILFFLALGYRLELSTEVFAYLLPILLIAGFILVFTPVLMTSLGFLLKLKSRPSFYMGVIVNQISEFSLILATLSLSAGIFSERVFTILTFACIATFVVSSIGHQFIEPLYRLFRLPLRPLDRHSRTAVDLAEEGFKLDGHVVLLGYNELTEELIRILSQERILVVDLDPEIYTALEGRHTHVRGVYADLFDPDTWEEAGFSSARLILSCVRGAQRAEVAIADWLRERGTDIPFVATTDSRAEALELYEHGATFVLSTDDAGARYIRMLFEGGRIDADRLAAEAREEIGRLEQLKADPLATLL